MVASSRKRLFGRVTHPRCYLSVLVLEGFLKSEPDYAKAQDYTDVEPCAAGGPAFNIIAASSGCFSSV